MTTKTTVPHTMMKFQKDDAKRRAYRPKKTSDMNKADICRDTLQRR